MDSKRSNLSPKTLEAILQKTQNFLNSEASSSLSSIYDAVDNFDAITSIHSSVPPLSRPKIEYAPSPMRDIYEDVVSFLGFPPAWLRTVKASISGRHLSGTVAEEFSDLLSIFPDAVPVGISFSLKNITEDILDVSVNVSFPVGEHTTAPGKIYRSRMPTLTLFYLLKEDLEEDNSHALDISLSKGERKIPWYVPVIPDKVVTTPDWILLPV